MKKLILLMAFAYLAILISCQQPKETKKSFAEMIREDTTRISELMKVADSLKWNYPDSSSLTENDDDEIDDAEVDSARKKDTIVTDGNKWPTIIIPVAKMKKFINNKTDDRISDSLIFYFATYKTQNAVNRYNTRIGKPGGPAHYTLDDLKGKPTIIINSYSNTKKNILKDKLDDMSRICPPPRGADCY